MPRGGIISNTTGLEPRVSPIDPSVRTLVLITAGQSQRINIAPTLYVPTFSRQIDALNVYDGKLYPITGPLRGTGYYPEYNLGAGNFAAYLADCFLADLKFGRVILAPVAVGGSVEDWATGILANRIPVAMRRFADLGITPNTPNVVFVLEWSQGPADHLKKTSRVVYLARLKKVFANARTAGFSGRIFVAIDTWLGGKVYKPVQDAQRAIVDGKTIFQSADGDSLGQEYRHDRAGHFNDLGLATVAKLAYERMQASGPPL